MFERMASRFLEIVIKNLRPRPHRRHCNCARCEIDYGHKKMRQKRVPIQFFFIAWTHIPADNLPTYSGSQTLLFQT